ncbi:MFS transporter [Streptomyces sp. NPDC057702]|uniref:MFS transporter n=1 Tax=unclassified Streptomyces TaxID=2593676 RepID=UPI003699647D
MWEADEEYGEYEVDPESGAQPPSVAPTPELADPPPSPGRVVLVCCGLLLTLLLAGLGQTVAVSALPEIVADVGGADRMAWVVTAYLLAATLVLPVYARLGDLVGRKGLFLFALVVFVAGSVLAGWSRTMEELIVFRALQGVGAGGLVIGAHAVALALAPPRRRGRLLGLLGAAFALAVAVGPLVGGLLTDHASWRWCCYLNAPLGLAALVAALCAPRLPRRVGRRGSEVFGALLVAAAVTCLALLTSWGGTARTWDTRTLLGIGLGALGAVILCVVVRYFARAAPAPSRAARSRVGAAPRRLPRAPVLVSGLVGAAVGVAAYGAASYLPTHTHRLAGVSATESGLLALPMLAGLVVTALLTGHQISRTGRVRAHPVVGCGLAALGMWLLSGLDAGSTRWTYGLWTGLLGLGLGLVVPVLALAVRDATRPTDGTWAVPGAATPDAVEADAVEADSAGARAALSRVGGGVGAAVFTTLFANRLVDTLARRLPADVNAPDADALTPEVVRALPAALRDGHIAAHVDALPRVFVYLVPVLVLGFLLAMLLKENLVASPTDQHDPTVPAARGLTDNGAGGAPSSPADQRTAALYATDVYAFDTDDQPRGEGQPLLAGAPVCGTVAHHDGSTVPRAALTLIDVGGRQVGRGATGDDGRYALSTPGAGAYVLIAAASGHQPQAVTVAVGERPVELDVVLGGAGRLAGSVRTADATPVRDALVTLTDVRGEVVASTRSGREGGYLITELVAGEYTLASSAPAYRPAALPVSVQAARETRQDIELAGGAVLRGTVRAGGGRTVEEARVTLLDAGGNVVDTATTGSDGVFRFIDLSAGEYTVIAAGYPPVATVLRVAGGGRTERDLHLGYED